MSIELPLDKILEIGIKVEVCSKTGLEGYSMEDEDIFIIIHKRYEDHAWVYGGSVTLSSNAKRIEIINAKCVFELLRDECLREKNKEKQILIEEVFDVMNKKVLENKSN